MPGAFPTCLAPPLPGLAALARSSNASTRRLVVSENSEWSAGRHTNPDANTLRVQRTRATDVDVDVDVVEDDDARPLSS